MLKSLTIRRPFDAHLHLRDGAVLRAVLPETSKAFSRALVMPNLVPPVVTFADAKAYSARIMAALPIGDRFMPLMTLYLTENTQWDDVWRAYESGLVAAVKLYPAGATTNSGQGIKWMERVIPLLEKMAQVGLRLCVHGEVNDPDIDIFDREAVFVDQILDPLCRRIPELAITLEHVTTSHAVAYIRESPGHVAGSITTHDLILNRNALLAGGIRPHYYCLPVLKRENDRLALRAAAVSEDNRFFLGTDSAPHLNASKECSCGCAGVFNATNALSCLAHVFEEEKALQKLEAFASIYGPAWYGIAPADEQITLVRSLFPNQSVDVISTDDGSITVFDPGFAQYWSVQQGRMPPAN